MLCLDVDEVTSGYFASLKSLIIGVRWFNPIRVVEKDYVKGEPIPLRNRIEKKIRDLGGDFQGGKIAMVAQGRCLGLYFSPANFYFCYQGEGNQKTCQYMLAEVSNTPWNERHYYLVDLTVQAPTDKVFHVSPFMDLNMKYHWQVKPPSEEKRQLLIHIENVASEDSRFYQKVSEVESPVKIFDATLSLKKVPLSRGSLLHVWLGLPVMTWNIVLGIYYQALKLFMKKIPFVSYQKKREES